MNKSSYWLTIHSTVKKQNKKPHKNLAEYVVEPSNTCSREPTQLPIENTDMVISLPCLKIFHVIPLSRKWSPKSSNKHFTIWLIYLSVPPSSTCQTLPSSQWGLYFQDCCFSFFFLEYSPPVFPGKALPILQSSTQILFLLWGLLQTEWTILFL